MPRLDEIPDYLVQRLPVGYAEGEIPFTEPTVVTILSLLSQKDRLTSKQLEQIQTGLKWLDGLQQPDGSVGINATATEPAWPTSWMLILSARLKDLTQSNGIPLSLPHFSERKAIEWLTSVGGLAIPRAPEYGHNTQLIGWCWALGTHSWLEPTCLAVLALKATGNGAHPRCREGIALIHDRLLSDGGANYGNTVILGQELRPHIEPTGLALCALAGESDLDGRIALSIDWLRNEIGADTAAASLCYALLGLYAHGIKPKFGLDWLEKSAQRVFDRDRSPYRLALLAWATSLYNNPQADGLGILTTPFHAQMSMGGLS